MKSIFPILLILSLFLSCNHQIEESAEEEGHKEIPSDWFYAQRSYPNGQIDKQAYMDAMRFKQQKSLDAAKRDLEEWDFAGPINIGGRVTDVEMPANSLDIMYIGSAAGGVFKSEDAGQNFVPILDEAMSLSVGDIDLAPSDPNVIYVGTGEPNAGGGSLAYDGVGVYRSNDAGVTWSHIGLDEAGSIGKVEVHPTDPNTAYVATMGNLFANDGERGVFKTTNGGSTWNQVLFISDSTGIIDMALHPNNPNTIYAAAWERVRRPNFRKYAGPTSGIFRSIDGGSTWEELTNGLPSSPFDKGRIGIAIAPSDSDILYAVYAGESGNISGAFRSNDGGDSWSSINTGGVDNVPYMWWFGKVIIHPTDPDRVHYLSLNGFYSANAGANWQMFFPGQHVDQHDVFIHPMDPSFIVSGNDGGIYISTNDGLSYEKVNTLPITQFYAVEIDEQFPNQIYGGAQDNGTNRTLTGGLDDWSSILGGDGFAPLVNPNDNSIVYASIQNGVFRKSINGGNSFTNATNGIPGSDRKNWNTPKVFDPNDPNIMYYGTQRLHKSIDGASSWTTISPDLSNGAGGINGFPYGYGTITTISVSPIDGNEIWVGTDDGNISLTTNGGTTWDNVSAIPNRWVTQVAADPNFSGVAYATLSGYRYGENIGHVYKTEDFGENWIDISGNLPDIPVNDIIIHPSFDDLYIATDIGVFVSDNNGTTWDILGLGLPNVVISDIDLHVLSGTLLAGTYGRSMYSILLEDFVGTKDLLDNDFEVGIAPNPFLQSTVLTIEVSESGFYKIDVFDVSGKMVKSVFDGRLEAGKQALEISSDGLMEGINFCRIVSDKGEQAQVKLMVLTR